jgi:hypothetical protein
MMSSLLLAAQHAVGHLMVQGRQVQVIPEKIHIWGQVRSCVGNPPAEGKRAISVLAYVLLAQNASKA